MSTSDPMTHAPLARVIGLLVEQAGASPFTVLDCGVGTGVIGRVIATAACRKRVHLVGVEIFEPYLRKSAVREKLEQQLGFFHHLYDQITPGDFARALRNAEARSVDAVVFGDSLDRLSDHEALDVLKRARAVARFGVLVTASTVYAPQGEEFGNPHEARRFHWPREEWERHGGIFVGGTRDAGCFLYLPRP